MEILGEKSGEKEVLMGVWLGRENEKNVVGSEYFFLEPTKMFSLQNWEKEN